MAGCGGSCGSGSCGSGSGHHGGHCASGAKVEEKPLRIGEELPTLPYETLYVRCQCGAVGFTPETWKEIGTSLITAGGKHYPTGAKSEWKCEPFTALAGDDRFGSDGLWSACPCNIIRGGEKIP